MQADFAASRERTQNGSLRSSNLRLFMTVQKVIEHREDNRFRGKANSAVKTCVVRLTSAKQ